jgi:hypothetical protein
MSQLFDRLRINSLRGIRGLELSGLGQVNLLVGSNDSGKTTVMEALSLLSHPLDPATWVLTARREQGLPLRVRALLLEQLRWLFPQQSSRPQNEPYEGEVDLSMEGDAPVGRVHAHYREIQGLKVGEVSEGAEVRGQQELGLELETQQHGVELEVNATWKKPDAPNRALFTFWEDEPAFHLISNSPPAIPLKVIRPQEHRLDSTLVQEFSDARMGGFQESVRGLLHELDPRIGGLEILAPRGIPSVFLQDAAAGLSPVSTFGDGIRRALLIALTLPRLEGGALLIDELETAIHVSALGKVFRWMLDACKQYRVQLFATTHSLEAVDAILGADTTEQEDIVGFRLERTEERTVVKRYGEDLLKRLRYERGLDVR